MKQVLKLYSVKNKSGVQVSFLLANFLLGVSFQGLVSLLLLLDPCQVVLRAGLQSLLILAKRQKNCTLYSFQPYGLG